MSDIVDTVRTLLAEGRGGVLEWVARDHGLSTLDVAKLLPENTRVISENVDVVSVLDDLHTWGEVFLIIQHRGLVAEIVTEFPTYSIARDHFNFKGDTTFSGHLHVDAIKAVACLDRPFSNRRSLSVVFFDAEGESIFKVFVRRDQQRNLLADQVEKFDALSARLAA
ncbi:MAG: heme utilization cystosolic carrier protein HutX [Pseudomonadota bacterium]